jgi:hypothetical protein
MNDIKTLRAYVKGRQLPAFLLLGKVKKEWLDYAYSVYSNTPVSSDYAKYQREKDGIKGTTVEAFDELTTYYNQLYTNELTLPNEYNILSGIHHLRFGKLEANSTLPFHLDEPFTLRCLCVIQGRHTFMSETGDSVVMEPGELYFVNGCYKHSVKNSDAADRVALLGKYCVNRANLRSIKNAIL